MSAAWHAGVIAQASKIPKLADLMPSDPRPKPKASPGRLLSIAAMWNAKLRGKAEPLDAPQAAAKRRV